MKEPVSIEVMRSNEGWAQRREERQGYTDMAFPFLKHDSGERRPVVLAVDPFTDPFLRGTSVDRVLDCLKVINIQRSGSRGTRLTGRRNQNHL